MSARSLWIALLMGCSFGAPAECNGGHVPPIHGRVTRLPDGQPLANVAVGLAEAGVIVATTDTNGEFSIPWDLSDLVGETGSLYFSHPEYLPYALDVASLSSVRTCAVSLTRGAWLEFALEHDGAIVEASTLPGISVGTRELKAYRWRGRYRSQLIESEAGAGRLRFLGYQPQRVSWDSAIGKQDLGAIELRGRSALLHVKDSSGRPIAGASVSGDYRLAAYRVGEGLRETNSQGSWWRGGFAASRLNLRIEKQGYTPEQVVFDFRGPPNTSTARREQVVILAAPAVIALEVRGRDGTLLTHANCRFQAHSGLQREGTVRSADGRLRFDVPAKRKLQLTVSAPGYLSRQCFVGALREYEVARLTRPLALDRDASRESGVFVLERCAEVRGVVRDQDGNPVAAATIALKSSSGTSLVGTQADATGAYRVRGLKGGFDYWLTVTKEECFPIRATLSVGHEESVSYNPILERGYFYRAKVVQADGKPLAARILFPSATPPGPYPFFFPTTTDRYYGSSRDGIIETRRLHRGRPVRLVVVAWMPGYELEREFQVEDPTLLPRLIEFPSHRATAGLNVSVDGFDDRVVRARFRALDGFPLHVRVIQDTIREHTLSFPQLHPGNYAFTVEARPWAPFAAPESVRLKLLSEEVSSTSLSLLARNRKEYVIEVRDPKGYPVEGAKVLVSESYANERLVTDDSGIARYSHHRKPRSIEIKVAGHEQVAMGAHSDAWTGRKLSVQLRPAVEKGRISIRVWPEPVAGSCRVELRSADRNHSIYAHREPIHGVAIFDDVPVGTYEVWHDESSNDDIPRSMTPVCISEQVVIEPDQDNTISLEVPEPLLVEGTIRIGNQPLAEGAVRFSTGNNMVGIAHIGNDGRYRARLRHRGPVNADLGYLTRGCNPLPIEITLGEPGPVDIHWPARDGVITFTDARGNPVPGVESERFPHLGASDGAGRLTLYDLPESLCSPQFAAPGYWPKGIPLRDALGSTIVLQKKQTVQLTSRSAAADWQLLAMQDGRRTVCLAASQVEWLTPPRPLWLPMSSGGHDASLARPTVTVDLASPLQQGTELVLQALPHGLTWVQLVNQRQTEGRTVLEASTLQLDSETIERLELTEIEFPPPKVVVCLLVEPSDPLDTTCRLEIESLSGNELRIPCKDLPNVGYGWVRFLPPGLYRLTVTARERKPRTRTVELVRDPELVEKM